MGFMTILGLIFITLKLTGHILWSWWWVLAPFWGPAVIALICLICFVASNLLFNTNKGKNRL
jgi:energy-coupling factor transporter transmembrane protein EcfT